MNDRYLTPENTPSGVTRYPMHRYWPTKQGESSEFVGPNPEKPVSASNEEFPKEVNEMEDSNQSSDNSDVHGAMIDRVRESSSLLQPESLPKSESIENVGAAPSIETDIIETKDLHKSVSDVLELLIDSTQRKNKSDLDDVMQSIEGHKNNTEQTMEQLKKQFARVTLKLHNNTKTSLTTLDDRIDAIRLTLEENQAENQAENHNALTTLDGRINATKLTLEENQAENHSALTTLDGRIDAIRLTLDENQAENHGALTTLDGRIDAIRLTLDENQAENHSALTTLDGRIDATKLSLEENQAENHSTLACEIASQQALTDSKINSISESVDLKITALITKVNNDMNNTFIELGKALTSVGNL
ncbi:MAG: hypothetical protein GY742_22080 [Hyphomicrobiales bacterium]|nr:hypothetical protein [Hyphomicrobiales bacterium]